MLLNLRSTSVSTKLPTAYTLTSPAAWVNGEKLSITKNIFGAPLQLPCGACFYSPAADARGSAPRSGATDDRIRSVFELERRADSAPVVSCAANTAAVPAATVDIPDYLSRPPAVQLALVSAVDEISKTEHMQITKLEAATSAVKNVQLRRKKPDRACFLREILRSASGDKSPSTRREHGELSRDPLAAFKEIDDAIGNRVVVDGKRGGVLPSLGADLHYELNSGMDPDSLTDVATRWFRHKKADQQKGGAAAAARNETGKGEEKKIPEFLPMLQHLCCQTMRVDPAKRPSAIKQEVRRSSLTVTGGLAPVNEEKSGPPVVTVVRQRGMKAVVEQLEFDVPLVQERLPRKQKSTKELGIQTEPQPAPLLQAAKALPKLSAKVVQPSRRYVMIERRSASPSTEGTLSDVDERVEAGAQELSEELQHREEEEKTSKTIPASEVPSADGRFGETAPPAHSAWQHAMGWTPPGAWWLQQQSAAAATGVPNPVKPPILQTPGEDPAGNYTFCQQPFPLPTVSSMPAFVLVAGGKRHRGGFAPDTATSNAEQQPLVQEPGVELEPSQASMPSWLVEEARQVFPPAFEQLLWQGVSLQNPAAATAFPLVQFYEEPLSNPWLQTVLEEAQLETQRELYQQWQQWWHRQWQAFVKAARYQREDRSATRQGDNGAAAGNDDSGEKRNAMRKLEMKVKKQQRMMAQEIGEEFEVFGSTQQDLDQTCGTQFYRGRAAIGNCRGGRRAWGIFDRISRTSAERKRQLRLKMLPEVDDRFDTVRHPFLHKSTGEVGCVRGGRRKHCIRLNLDDSQDLKGTPVQERGTESAKRRPTTNSVQEHPNETSDKERRGNVREKESKLLMRRIIGLVDEDDEVMIHQKTKRAKEQIASGEGRQWTDWYEKEKHRLARERKMDTVLEEVAKRFGVPSQAAGDNVCAGLSVEALKGEATANDKAARLRDTLAQGEVLKLRQRLYVSEKVTELKRLGGLIAAGKLPPELMARQRERPAGHSERQQVFVGILNMKEGHRRASTDCAAKGISKCFARTTQPCRKNLNFEQDIFDASLEAKGTELLLKRNQHVSQAFEDTEQNGNTKRCSEKNVELLSGACRGPWASAAQTDSRVSTRVRGRTLLDVSPAALSEITDQERLRPFKALPMHAGETVFSVVAEAENGQTRPTRSRGTVMQTCADISVSEEDPAKVFKATKGMNRPLNNAGNSHEAGEALREETSNRLFSTALALTENMSGSTAVNNGFHCGAHSSTQGRKSCLEPFLVNQPGAVRERPAPAMEADQNVKAFAIAYKLQNDINKQNDALLRCAASVADNKSGWKTRLDEWQRAAENSSFILARFPRPVIFPWDEDVIPTCQERATEAIGSGMENSDTLETLDSQRGSTRTELRSVAGKSEQDRDTGTEGLRQSLAGPRKAKHRIPFLRSGCGTGGGDYAKSEQHTNKSSRENAKTILRAEDRETTFASTCRPPARGYDLLTQAILCRNVKINAKKERTNQYMLVRSPVAEPHISVATRKHGFATTEYGRRIKLAAQLQGSLDQKHNLRKSVSAAHATSHRKACATTEKKVRFKGDF